MWKRDTFLRPTAHRGLHNADLGIIENTRPAFEAAMTEGVGIECDLQRTKDNVPVVFHDFTLDRLLDGHGPVCGRTYAELQAVSYQGQTEAVMSLDQLLDCIGDRVPVLLELKSDWSPPNTVWLTAICKSVERYRGAAALMSFDPALMLVIKTLAPKIPRGLVSGIYRHPERDPWWPNEIDHDRARDLTNLSDVDIVEPDFIAYHVADLDTPPVHYARCSLSLPIFTWTVRTDQDWQLSEKFADAAIFEGARPTGV